MELQRKLEDLLTCADFQSKFTKSECIYLFASLFTSWFRVSSETVALCACLQFNFRDLFLHTVKLAYTYIITR